MECAGMSQPLFIVTGSCQGLEICLDQDSIPFGAVVQGSSSKRRFVMLNRGDIGAGYVHFTMKKFQSLKDRLASIFRKENPTAMAIRF